MEIQKRIGQLKREYKNAKSLKQSAVILKRIRALAKCRGVAIEN